MLPNVLLKQLYPKPLGSHKPLLQQRLLQLIPRMKKHDFVSDHCSNTDSMCRHIVLAGAAHGCHQSTAHKSWYSLTVRSACVAFCQQASLQCPSCGSCSLPAQRSWHGCSVRSHTRCPRRPANQTRNRQQRDGRDGRDDTLMCWHGEVSVIMLPAGSLHWPAEAQMAA